MPRFAVVGHVEWVDFLTVPRVPLAGEIVHASKWWSEPAGGGAVAAVQLAKLAGTATFFTALGNDDHARRAEEELRAHGVEVEAVRRDRPQRRGVALLDARGERTIVVQGERIVPVGDDDLPWERLADMDGVYFTGGDAASLRAARAARTLVATPRAHDAFKGSNVTLDALVRSAGDAGEQEDWSANLTVSTRGPDGGMYKSADGRSGSFEAAPLSGPVVDAYGAGDSFAAGLTFALGSGMDLDAALALAARCGAANLTGAGPYAGQLDRGGMAGLAPSGEQWEIALDAQRAVVVEVGGGLRTYSAAGRDVLDGYGADEMCPSGRGQVLSPWPNRVQDGSYEFDGRRHQLPIDQVDEHNAIHGLVRWAAWEVAERDAHRVAVEHVLHPRPGYPFSLGLRIEYELSAEGLRVRNTATNLGSEAVSLRDRGASVPDRRDRPRRRGGPARAGAHRAALGRARHPHWGRPRRRHRLRLPAAAADRRRRGSTTASPISSATRTVVRAWSCAATAA